MKKRIDPIMAVVVNASGALVLSLVAALLFFLAQESRYAFDQVFPYGFRFAVTGANVAPDYDTEQDPYASVISANIEGQDGIDEKEEVMPMPSVDQLLSDTEVNPAGGTGTYIRFIAGEDPPKDPVDLDAIDPMMLFRDDWRSAKRAEKGDRFLLFAFGTPNHKAEKMTLRWGPEAAYLSSLSPYDIRLKLLRSPEGVTPPDVNIDLNAQPKGSLEIPTWIAKTDEDRTKGYVFEIIATPRDSTTVAAIKNIFQTDWAPTLNYARYGIIPLVISSLIITLCAVLLATPVSIALAIYISEFAPIRTKELLKPTIELLASIPTVVLAYFGLMTIGPFLVTILGGVLGMENSRSMITVAVMMAILLIPTIATIAEDALSALPTHLRDGAEALGLTRGEAIRKVILPATKAGLIGAVLLGTARAFGETMLVWLLSGGTVKMPADGIRTLGQSTKAIPDTIGIEMGNVTTQSPHYGHLFLLGLLLFGITLIVNLTGYKLAKKATWTQ